jgi:hypothetical protein
VVIRFTTTAGRAYRIEQTDGLDPFSLWRTVSGASRLEGTGGIVTFTHVGGADQPMRYYRVRLLY